MGDAEEFECLDDGCELMFPNEKKLHQHLKKDHDWTDEEIETGEKEYEIESILTHEYDHGLGQYTYEVKWKGNYDNSIIEEENFGEENTLLPAYKKLHGLGDGPPARKPSSRSVSKDKTSKDEAGPSKRRKSPKEVEESDDEPLPKKKKRKSSSEEVEEAPEVPNKTKDRSSSKEKVEKSKKNGNLEEYRISEKKQYDKFRKERKFEKLVGISCDDKKLWYLVKYRKLEGERTREACRLISADLAWDCHLKAVREYFEKGFCEQNGIKLR